MGMSRPPVPRSVQIEVESLSGRLSGMLMAPAPAHWQSPRDPTFDPSYGGLIPLALFQVKLG